MLGLENKRYFRMIANRSVHSVYHTHFLLTRLLRQTTGHNEHPSVQQQHTHPQNNHLAFTGKVFLSTELIRPIVAEYSSGATLDTRPFGNSVSKRLLNPNLKTQIILLVYCAARYVWVENLRFEIC